MLIPHARQTDSNPRTSETDQHRHGKPPQLPGIGPPVDVLEKWKSSYFHFTDNEITPKALVNFSPGLERSDNPGLMIKLRNSNPERVNLRKPNAFSVDRFLFLTQGCR